MSVESTDSPTAAQPSGNRSGRDRRGRFSVGNRKSLKHGRFSLAVAKALLPEQQELLSTLADREAAILVDLGGQSDLSTFERDLVSRYQQLGAIADFNASRMLATRVGVRREATGAFMNAVDRQLKIVAMLGAARRTKQTYETPAEWLERTSTDHDEQQPAADHDDHTDAADGAITND